MLLCIYYYHIKETLMKRTIALSVILALVMLTGGCDFLGNSGGSSTTVAPTPNPGDGSTDPDPTGSETGVFVDSPVVNLSYETSPTGVTGTTDENGGFEYNEGDTITFRAGSIVLGSAPASPYLTPYSFFPNDEEQALNLAQFLQSIDSNGDPEDGITPDEDALAALINADFSSAGFEQWLRDTLPQGLRFVEREEAMEHMEDTFNKLAIDPNGTVQSTERLFAGYDAEHGIELWVTKDGRDLQFVKDLDAENERAYPEDFVMVGSDFYFTAISDTGEQLWKSDGTEAGTVLVKEFTNEMYSLAAFDDSTLIFRVNDSVHGSELWISDGTEAGTVMLKDIIPGPNGSSPYGFTSFKGKSYFRAAMESMGVYVVGVTDGTEAGTVAVQDVNGNLIPQTDRVIIQVAGEYIWFETPDKLYVSDGTKTVDAMDIEADSALLTFKDDLYVQTSTDIYRLTPADAADALTNEAQLVAPASYAYPANNTIRNSFIYNTDKSMVAGEDSIFLLMRDTSDSYNARIYYSDGTGDPFANVLSVSDSYTYGRAFVMNEDVYFLYYNVLYKADITAGTISAVTSKVDGIKSFYQLGDELLFYGYDVDDEYGFWSTDGTDAGTTLIKSIGDIDIPSRDYNAHVELNGKIYFSGNFEGKFEPWMSDGTAAGTAMLKDVNATPSNGLNMYVASVKAENGYVLNDSSYKLWTSDGTEAGTVMADSSIGNIEDMYAVGRYAIGYTCENECRFLRSDGTQTGTQFIGPAYGDIEILSYFGDKTLFIGETTDTFEDIYVIIDIQGNVTRLEDIDGNHYDGDLEIIQTISADDELVIVAMNAADETLLYVYLTDGTQDGTVLAGEIQLSDDLRYISSFEYTEGKLFTLLTMDDDTSTLWATDLTAMNSVKLRDFLYDEHAAGLLSVEGDYYYTFKAEDFSSEYLWKTDGTVDGSALVLATPKPDNMPPVPIPLFYSTLLLDDMFYVSAYVEDGFVTYLIRTSSGTVKELDMEAAGLSGFRMLSSYVYTGTQNESGYALNWFENPNTGAVFLVRILGSSMIKVMEGQIGLSS
jgi:ELWxxDGT repeat protein